MIRLFLADGRKIHVNPAAIAYLEQLPERAEGGAPEKDQPKTKIVLLTGDSVLVRQGAGQVLIAAGLATPKKEREDDAADGSNE